MSGEWSEKTRPVQFGWYAIMYGWDAQEGVFVGADYWNPNETWAQGYPVLAVHGPHPTQFDALTWAKKNDPDSQPVTQPATPEVGDNNVQRVVEKYLKRAEFGLEKYGVTTERTDVDLIGWLVHLQHELMDATIYIEQSMRLLQEKEAAPESTLDDLRQLIQEFLLSNDRNRWLYFDGGKVYVRKSRRMIAGEAMQALDIANISVDMQRQGHGTVVVNALHNAHFYPATYIENVMIEGWANSLERNGWIPNEQYPEWMLTRSFYKRR